MVLYIKRSRVSRFGVCLRKAATPGKFSAALTAVSFAGIRIAGRCLMEPSLSKIISDVTETKVTVEKARFRFLMLVPVRVRKSEFVRSLSRSRNSGDYMLHSVISS